VAKLQKYSITSLAEKMPRKKSCTINKRNIFVTFVSTVSSKFLNNDDSKASLSVFTSKMPSGTGTLEKI
jgi:hypothetical protein